MDGLGKLFTVILAGILVFMIPLRSIVINYQSFTKNHIEEHTKEFANNVMEKGYLSLEMYDSYINNISPSNSIYEVELIHSVPTQGILGSYMEVCPNDHIYEVDSNMDRACSICHETVAGIDIDIVDRVIERGEDIKAYLTIIYLDGHRKVIEEGFSYDLDSTIVGAREVRFYYEDLEEVEIITVIQSHICPTCDNVYYHETEEDLGCLVCNNRVQSIRVDLDFYIVSLDSELEIEVTAFYPNNRIEKVTNWTSSFNPNKPGLQHVIIHFENVVTSTKVFVETNDTTACPNCNSIYNNIEFIECPTCSKIVIGIEVDLSKSGKIKLGSELNPDIVLIYYNNSREIAKGGYEIIGYEPNTLGIQNVCIRYKEHEVMHIIEVVDHINTSVCQQDHYYFLEVDGTDNGCPLCNNNEISEDFSLTYFDNKFTEDILTEIYSNGIYYFNEGDYFTVNISNNSNRILSGLIQFFFLTDNQSSYSYGGIIHDKFF